MIGHRTRFQALGYYSGTASIVANRAHSALRMGQLEDEGSQAAFYRDALQAILDLTVAAKEFDAKNEQEVAKT
jgi:hypothetical protein